MKFRKKPVVIEAHRWDGDNVRELTEWAHEGMDPAGNSIILYDGYSLLIRTLEGQMRADVGDMIIRGVKGEFYPCKPDIFAATYEPASLGSPETPQSERTQSWAVTVWRNGESVVTLSSADSGGRDITDEDARVVRMAGEHLQAFIGHAPPETPQEDAAPPLNNILWRVERMIVDTAHQMTFGTTLEREFYRGFNAAYQNVRNMLKEQPPPLLAAPEGRVREIIKRMRSQPHRWLHDLGSIIEVIYADKVEEWADELEAALAPLAAPSEPKS